MRPDELEALIEDVRAGRRDVDEAVTRLRHLPVDDIGFAVIDTHREARIGLPEAIFASGKEPHEVVAIARRMMARAGPVIATRVPDETARLLLAEWPEARDDRRSRTTVVRRAPAIAATIMIVAAGTSDLAVAGEVAAVADAHGAQVELIADVGVAGLHRILAHEADLRAAEVVVVVAGMDGALPSIVGGLTPAPVIAVPTSVGYGSSFEGLAALLTMMNSCAPGIAVMNIDNGYGAACCALRILNRRVR